MFKEKILLITGGTGSFGNAVCKRLLSSSIQEIRILSRDEKKQDDMRKKLGSDKIKFYLGDVRDVSSITTAMQGVDYVFHAAALKQVPSCEFFPLEAMKTNVMGTNNVLDVAITCKVEKVICLSTDKAVYPINAMGMSKALMEKVAISKSRESKGTTICITRYGNVIASRGSVIPLFIDQIYKDQPLTITNANMTRFMMTLDEAVDLVEHCFQFGNNGDLYVQKSPSATIAQIAQATIELLGMPSSYPINEIGFRHGEKKHEVLLSSEEMINTQDLGKYYKVARDERSLNYGKFFDVGSKSLEKTHQFDSSNTVKLGLSDLKDILEKNLKLKDR